MTDMLYEQSASECCSGKFICRYYRAQRLTRKRQKQGSYLQGKREGREEGRKEGVAEGFQEAKYVIAKAMLDLGKLSVAEIAQASKLTEAEVLALKDA